MLGILQSNDIHVPKEKVIQKNQMNKNTHKCISEKKTL